jgi:hypothetical protein
MPKVGVARHEGDGMIQTRLRDEQVCETGLPPRRDCFRAKEPGALPISIHDVEKGEL